MSHANEFRPAVGSAVHSVKMMHPQSSNRSPSRQGAGLARVVVWLGGILVLMLALLLSIWLIYGWRARVAFERRLADLAASGEVMKIDLLLPAAVDPADNADTDISAAIARLPSASAASKALAELDDAPAIPLSDAERQLLSTYLAEHKEAFALLLPATQKPVAVTRITYASPMISTLLPTLQPQRDLARLCQLKALAEFDAGRHDRAIEALGPIEPLAVCAESNRVLIGTLVGTAMRGTRNNTLAELSPGLKIGQQPGDVPPEQVRELIARLLDHRQFSAGWVGGLRGERLIQIDTIECLAGGSLSPNAVAGSGGGGGTGLGALFARPLVYSNGVEVLEVMQGTIRAAEAPDLPSAKSALSPVNARVNTIGGQASSMFARMLIPAMTPAFNKHYRERTMQNLAATALAIRWYQADHNGKLPATLNDLVPAYLPTVPIDLMDGKPLRFRGTGDRPMIWSVGEDMTDDGGDDSRPEKSAAARSNRWQGKDAVVDLTRRAR